MIVSLFRNNKPTAAILLIIAVLAFWWPVLNTPIFKPVANSMPLFSLLQNILVYFPKYAIFVSAFLALLGGYMLYFVLDRHDVLTGHSYLPSLMYVTLISCSPSLTTLHPILLANIFIIWMLNPLISLYRNENAIPRIFDLALLLSLAVLSYLPAIALLPLVWIGIIIYRSFNLREWVVALFGMSTPFFILLTYYFWNDILMNAWEDKVVYAMMKTGTPVKIKPNTYYLICSLFLLIILSISKVFEHFGTTSMKTGKAMTFLVWLIFSGFASAFIIPTWTIRDFGIIAIPLAIFIGNYLSLARARWLAEALYMFLVASIVLVRMS